MNRELYIIAKCIDNDFACVLTKDDNHFVEAANYMLKRGIDISSLKDYNAGLYTKLASLGYIVLVFDNGFCMVYLPENINEHQYEWFLERKEYFFKSRLLLSYVVLNEFEKIIETNEPQVELGSISGVNKVKKDLYKRLKNSYTNELSRC